MCRQREGIRHGFGQARLKGSHRELDLARRAPDPNRRSMQFGHAARSLWTLDPDGVFLNHGSFGACPISVLEKQSAIRDEMERHPDHFFLRSIEPSGEATPLRRAAAALAAFVRAPELAFVESTTVGVEAVLRAFTLKPKDEVLITSHQYNAVKRAAQRRCHETGATLIEAAIPEPSNGAEIIERVLAAVTDATRLAIIDHITSATALVFPVKDLVAALRARGVKVMIDGAHAVGQLDLDIGDIDADWYVTNAHKWLFAPKGSALFYARRTEAAHTHPAITSHFYDLGFPAAFDYVGTRDYTAWLSTPAALDFYTTLDGARVRAHAQTIIAHTSKRFEDLGARPLGPIVMSASMRVFELPTRQKIDHATALHWRDTLWDKHKVQIKPDGQTGRLHVRISASPYVDRADIDRLTDLLAVEGWPERA